MATSISNLLSGGSTGSSSGTSQTGLGQGIDVSSFVQLAEASQTAQISNLQSQKAAIISQLSALSPIQADLTALQTAASALNAPLGALSSEIATSSNPNVVTANASSSASPGTHTIAITSLATTSSYYSDAVAAGTTPLATSDTLSVSAGGTQVASVTVGASNNNLNAIAAAITSQATSSQSDDVAATNTALLNGDTIAILANGTQVASVTTNASIDTLASVAQAINAQTSAVQASVVTDATGAHLSIASIGANAPGNVSVTGTLHRTDNTAVNFNQVVAVNASVIEDANGARLAIVSSASGAPGNLAIAGTLHQTNNTAINLTQAVPGNNAVFSVDGVPISSSTNSVSNVIPGVTLNLTGPTGGTPASLTVSPDTSSISAAINTFVSAYNTALSAINAQFSVGSNGSTQPLEADGSLRDVQQQLLSAASYATAGAGGSVNLTSLGINTNNDGTLSVDSGKLTSALSSNFSGVQSFLQTATTGFAANFNSVLNNLNGPGNGELSLDAQTYTSSSTDLTGQISDLQAALADQTTNLTAVYAQVNATLQELPLLQSQLTQQLASIA